MIKIKGHSGLKRDLNSNSIINVDIESYNKHKNLIEKQNNQERRILELEKKLNTAIRRNEFSDSLISYNILDDIKIKPLRLLIRKRSSTGIFKLGFDTTLNTATTKLGFEGGASITITDLIDEELT